MPALKPKVSDWTWMMDEEDLVEDSIGSTLAIFNGIGLQERDWG